MSGGTDRSRRSALNLAAVLTNCRDVSFDLPKVVIVPLWAITHNGQITRKRALVHTPAVNEPIQHFENRL